MKRVRIVQLFLSQEWAEMHGPCVLTGKPSTGTFTVDNIEEHPVNLKVLGPGSIGAWVTVPPELEERVPESCWDY